MYEDLTVKNPSFPKRFSHTRRFDIALELLKVEGDDVILDYGTGDGFMLIKLLSAGPKAVFGYEPMDSQYRQLEAEFRSRPSTNVTITDNLDLVESRQFDKVCCLEVLEHLTEANPLSVLSTIQRLLKKKGVLVVSVPMEVGLSGRVKNLARLVLGQKHGKSSVMNIIKAFLGLRIDRGQEA